VTLASLAVQDFRNLERVDLVLPADGLVVVGENGHGKTNLLEAIYYLQLLRSMRGARDQDLVRFGAAGFHVGAHVVRPSGGGAGAPGEIGVGFQRQGKKKRARLEGAEPPRLSDALGAVPSVIFSPADVALVAGSPAERRRYLDVMLALTSRRYLVALQHYRGALARRNAALRDVARSGAGDQRVSVWEPALAEHGAVLWEARVAWAERAAEDFAARCTAIGELSSVRLRYATALAPRGRPTADALADALAAQRAHDVRRAVTHAGPHRDDLALTLDGRELRLFGSAGQQRTAAIALRMLEAATLRERVGAPPVFLMDDPFAELDLRRSHRILELLGEGGMGQVVLTVPRAADIPVELTWLERFRIEGGVLSRG
jgi:DNA replication and repair protein RecF